MSVSIEPTNLCNYRCTFCPQSEPEHRELPHGLMKLEHLDDILDKVHAAGAAWRNIISFTHDGEPFLHPQFTEFVRRAGMRGYRSRFSSNGSRMTPARVDQLVCLKVPFLIAVDFSGSREIFQTCRSRRDDWEQVRDHLSYLIHAANQNPQVGVEVREIATWVEPARAQEHFERMKRMLPQARSRKIQLGIRNFHNASGLVQLTQQGQPSANGHPRKRRYRRCPYPWTSLNIAWNGNVHACPRDLRGQTTLGNILEVDSLESLWNGASYQAFRRCHAQADLSELGSCSGCDLPWRHDRQRWSWRYIAQRLKY